MVKDLYAWRPTPKIILEGSRTTGYLAVATLTAFGLAAAPQARAGSIDPRFDFTFSIGPDTGYGSVDAVPAGGGEFNATDGSLTVTGGDDIGTYTLLPGGPGDVCSPGCEYGYDDDLFPASTPAIDQFGLVFTSGDIQVTLTAPNADDYYFLTFSPEQGLYLENDTSGNAYFSLTPEPKSSTLLGAALVGLCVMRYWKIARVGATAFRHRFAPPSHAAGSRAMVLLAFPQGHVRHC